MELPFKHGKVVETSYFVNRKEEIHHLQNNFISKINTTLISPRRWGKSSLVLKASKDLTKKNKRIRFVYLDLFNIRSEEEFYKTFTKEVLKVSYTKWEDRLKKATEFFKQLIPKFSFGIDPQNEFSVSFNWHDVMENPSEILNLPEVISKEKKIEIVICLDEFQNIGHFNNPLAFQKKLRAHWQYHQIATYCMYGSKRNMMTEIFEHKSMPFYKFGDVIFLQKISTTHWVKYIIKKFKKTNKVISHELAKNIVKLVENHSYYTQQLANKVWLNTADKVSKKNIEKSINQLIENYEMLFQKELDTLTNQQVNLLKAIVNNELQLNNKNTIKKYNLGTSSSVTSAKKALILKEVIDIYNKEIIFLDPLFKNWFQHFYIQKT
ncbi:MAG: hypothetical protein L3J23_03730 [Flavobacteriaceae bacterium]|nr:hypothetical protein [Flavobacteriaceae bacterium]